MFNILEKIFSIKTEKFELYSNHKITFFGIKYKYKTFNSKRIVSYNKQIRSYNVLFNKILTPSRIPSATGKLREYQLRLVNFGKEVIQMLEKENFHPMLVGGALIGAVRHGGFVPWDDDLDFDLMRDEYNRLIEFMKEKFIYISTYNCKSDDDCYELVDKAIVKNPNKLICVEKTSCISIFKGEDLEDCIVLDFFPRDYLNPKVTKEIYSKYREKQQKTLKKGNKNYKIYFDKYREELNNNEIYAKESNLTGYGWGNISFTYKKFSIMPIDVVKPYTRINFEGIEFYTLNNYQEYLKDFYKNYMNIPKNIELCKYIKYFSEWLKSKNRKFYFDIDDIIK